MTTEQKLDAWFDKVVIPVNSWVSRSFHTFQKLMNIVGIALVFIMFSLFLVLIAGPAGGIAILILMGVLALMPEESFYHNNYRNRL